MHRPRPAIRRAIIAVPFLAALLLAMRLDRGPSRSAADAAHPGFVLRDETAAAGVHFVHQRPSFDPKIAGIEPHVAALGASVSVTDFDGDGRPDLYFTNSHFGAPNALYRNKGDGTFEDVAASAGLADLNNPGEGVSMGSVWGDFDNDGREDVLVYRYGYLALFRNLGGGKFEDVTEAAGLRRWVNSNGAIWLDYDRDGLLDLYVTAYFRSDVDLWHLTTTRIMHNSFEFATNGGKNLLFHNVGNGKFEDVTDKMGVGSTRWSLAAASADFNDDGWPDIYLANDYGPEELYLNDHGRRFVLTKAGLESESKSGMSPALGDASLSGYEHSRVYFYRGAAGWADVAKTVGVTDDYDGRAVALVDASNRGAVDVVVANQNQPAVLYRDYPDSANHWIAFNLVGTRSNRSAIGAEVVLESGELTQRRVVDGGSGFASQNDRRLHFGLGRREWVDRVVIHWPSGTQQVLARPPINQIVTVTEPRR